MSLTIGKYTYGSPIMRGTHNNVTIGKYCSIAEGVIFDGGFSHNHRNVSTYPFQANMPGCAHLPLNLYIKGDINIGSDVWIGEQAVVMSGVTIGDGAVIGMRAIVTKDVAPYEIVVADHRGVGKRFTDEQIKLLLAIQWWNWNDDQVRENAHLLLSTSIEEFIAKGALISNL